MLLQLQTFPEIHQGRPQRSLPLYEVPTSLSFSQRCLSALHALRAAVGNLFVREHLPLSQKVQSLSR